MANVFIICERAYKHKKDPIKILLIFPLKALGKQAKKKHS